MWSCISRIDTGRYEGLPIDQRLCPFCNVLEDEKHVVLECSLYDDIRSDLIDKAISLVPEFQGLHSVDKMPTLFTNLSLIRSCAKNCYLIVQRRIFCICK